MVRLYNTRGEVSVWVGLGGVVVKSDEDLYFLEFLCTKLILEKTDVSFRGWFQRNRLRQGQNAKKIDVFYDGLPPLQGFKVVYYFFIWVVDQEFLKTKKPPGDANQHLENCKFSAFKCCRLLDLQVNLRGWQQVDLKRATFMKTICV